MKVKLLKKFRKKYKYHFYRGGIRLYKHSGGPVKYYPNTRQVVVFIAYELLGLISGTDREILNNKRRKTER